MRSNGIPQFVIKNNFQKRNEHYSDILTEDILKDICRKVTGLDTYTVEFDNSDYNIGRLALLEHNNTISYISFSDPSPDGRNSSFQSVTSALSRFILDTKGNKKIFFYFLPPSSNIETKYFVFMYRVMKSAGIDFLNDWSVLTQTVRPFSTVEDIITARNINREYNRSNNSTFITRSSEYESQIYGKMYGANKYETTLLGVALSYLSTEVEIYQVSEGDLTELPKTSQDALNSLRNVRLIASDFSMERKEFSKQDNLRSPLYIYNLLYKLGPKRCALCDCEIPELIQGAHIWPISEIKKVPGVNIDKKLRWATDGDNGLWLCENHHKMFDAHLITIKETGNIEYPDSLEENHKKFIIETTPHRTLEPNILSSKFLIYLRKRLSIQTLL